MSPRNPLPLRLATLATLVTVPLLLAPRVASAAGAASLPLPDAPVVLLVEDVPALEQALGGGFRKALTGKLPADDRVASGWRRTRVGGKLEEQWGLFAGDLGLDWTSISALKPTAVGLSILSAGNLEAVLAIATPLAEVPWKLPAGTRKDHRGIPYAVVSPGAGDDRTAERRIGLAWARTGGVLLLATSERALLLALDRSLSGGTREPGLAGFATVRLDLEALRKDLYFRREFLFAEGTAGPGQGVLNAALRLEGGELVEVREGATDETGGAASWGTEGRSLRAAGWEKDVSRLLSALRGALLEPVPSPAARPGSVRRDLPSVGTAGEDRYAVDYTRPGAAPGELPSEAELPSWRELLAEAALTGFGWEISDRGAPRLVLGLPRALDERFAALVVETLSRRSGGATREADGSVTVGPSLSAIATRRTGDWLWVGVSAAELLGVPEPASSPALSRWGRLSFTGLDTERRLWAEAEGTFSPDVSRPFSDRLLGLLGWAPSVVAVSSERRLAPGRFTERIRFERGRAPAPKKPATSPKAAPKKKGA